MHTNLGCDPDPIQEMLGEKDIKTSNVMIYLGLIEQRMNKILHANYRIQKNVCLG